MSGDEMIFDPTMTKKKKKKKKPFMLEEDGGEGDEGHQLEIKETEADGAEEKELDLDEDEGRKKETSDDLDDLNFFNQKKKKKKSKKEKIFDAELEEGMKELKIETEPSETQEEDDLMLPMRKKKTRKVKDFQEDTDSQSKDDGVEDEDSKNIDDITFSTQMGPAWAGSERDYTYDELLNRVFNIMREKNPDMVAGEKRKFVMKPPQVVRVGTKKTSFVNFTDICKLLHRQPKHLLAFLLAELGTRLIARISICIPKEYVTCHTCRSPETILQKDTRLYFLQCETCHSRCSVASIKTGFQAVTGKRAQMRAKAN
ncbi:hypothetical protein cypCar_00004833 [Cyprinus carpio]|nr:hypothetical protein cypCar_00004833 [Cyprinus carpio]